MGRAFLVWVFLVGAIASCMTNIGSRMTTVGTKGSSTHDGFATPSGRSGDAESSTENWGDDVIALERESDGHFYADVEINGQTIHMLVDTGASVIALSREDAQSVGLANSIGMPDVVGEGASGAVHGEVVNLDSVSLGSKTSENMTAVVLDGGSQSLLGQSFLSQFDSVGIHGDTMVLQ